MAKRKKAPTMPGPHRGLGSLGEELYTYYLVAHKELHKLPEWEKLGRPNWCIRYTIPSRTVLPEFKFAKTGVPTIVPLLIACIVPVGTSYLSVGTCVSGNPQWHDAAWEAGDSLGMLRDRVQHRAEYGPRSVTWGTDLTEDSVQTYSTPPKEVELKTPTKIIRPVYEGNKVVDWTDQPTEDAR